MSIIAKVGRRSPKMIALSVFIHLVLLIGAVTMIYPFLLMVSSSFKSSVDNTRLTLIPEYFHQDQALFQKYTEARYNEESGRMTENYAGNWLSFSEVRVPNAYQPALYQDWKEFIRLKRDDYGVYDFYVSEHYGRGVYPRNQRQLRKLLRKENDGDLRIFNSRYNTGAQSWEEIAVEEKEILSRNFMSSSKGYLGRFQEFKLSVQDWHRLYINLDGHFIQSGLYPEFNGDLAKLNAALGSSYQDWNQIILSETCPLVSDPLRPWWLEYVQDNLNIHHIRINPSANYAFREMLANKYDSIALLNITWNTAYLGFSQVSIPERVPDSGAIVDDLTYFVHDVAAPEDLRILNLANDWRQFLNAKHTGATYPQNIETMPFPILQIEYGTFLEHKTAIRREFLVRNYAMVLDQMLKDSLSLRNTLIYCFLSILLAVTINPLAAYALSRFKPRFAYQVIMLFMLTMAFPAMVIGIPNFLMLKRLNLLNTFWALVLPAAADGYFIFLLKSFFDSLPKELYESARIDGAGEFRMFWQFTLYLSKPILAVIALGAFNAAYRNFLFAFIVCQDQSMWTLMVHIYELMQRASLSVGYAALTIAAIPTLAVFVFFQNLIIKGIVIPMEK
ncbi:MAG: ABC transporter permease subunit [Candidatus Cloacimonetes bacterium]|nr:ABC transporter permease subunit [Candidatus Cloacimonadota bacterium]